MSNKKVVSSRIPLKKATELIRLAKVFDKDKSELVEIGIDLVIKELREKEESNEDYIIKPV